MRLLLVLLVLAVAGRAQGLTLDEALERAEARSHGLRIEQLDVEASRAEWHEDIDLDAPTLRLDARDLDLTGSSPEWELGLRLPIPQPWELATRAAESAARARADEAALDVRRSVLRVQVTSSYHQLALLRESVEVARRLLAPREIGVELATRQRAQGLITTFGWLEAEEERRDAADDLADQERRAREAEGQLRDLLVWPVDEALHLDDPVVLSELEAGLEPATADGSPDLRRAEARVELARSRLTRRKARGIPWVEWLQGGVVAEEGTAARFGFKASVELPVSWWAPSRTRRARAELRAAELRLEQRRHRLASRSRAREWDAAAARAQWRVEASHLEVVRAEAAPLLGQDDRALRLELDARLARAELRELRARRALVEAIDSTSGVVAE